MLVSHHGTILLSYYFELNYLAKTHDTPMLKFCRICLSSIIACLALTAHAEETRYISDDLNTYVHSGPGNQYRIVGSVSAGEEVSKLSVNNETKYTQIRDAKGRIVWLPSDQISSTPGLKSRVPALEAQVKTLTDKLANIDNTWNKKTADMQSKVGSSDSIINNLKEENAQLKSQLASAQKTVNAANIQLDDKKRGLIMQWFAYGGSVAGIGLLVGLLLPHIIPRRRRKDNWMN